MTNPASQHPAPIPEEKILSLTATAELVDEIKRLRTALREIADIPNYLTGSDWDEIEEAREIASAALSTPLGTPGSRVRNDNLQEL